MSGTAATKAPTASPPTVQTPTPASQAFAALRNIVLAAIVLAGIFWVYAGYAKDSEELKKLRGKITELTKHDTPKTYREAAGLLDQGLKIRAADPYFVATRAEVAAIEWVENGYADQQATAENYSRQAVDRAINTAPRFDAQTMTLLGNGKVSTTKDGSANAEDVVNNLLQQGVSTPALVAVIGEVHLRQGRLEAAKSDFKQIQDLFPRYGASYGEALYMDGDLGGAQSAFARQAEMNPDHTRSLIDRARVDIARGDRLAEAGKTFDELLPASGGGDDLSPVLKSHVLAGKAELALALGDVASAEKFARMALDPGWKLDPMMAFAQFDLGMALARQNKPGASEQFLAAISQYQYMPRVYFQGAVALAQSGHEPEGKALLELYKKNDLKQDDAYQLAWGDFWTALGKTDDAATAYDEAIKLSKNLNAEALYKRALITEAGAAKAVGPAKLKTLKDALDMYDKALAVRPRYPEALRREAIIFLGSTNADVVQTVGEKLGKALAYFNDAHVSKAVLTEFLTDTYQRLLKAGPKFRSLVKEWKDEMDKDLK